MTKTRGDKDAGFAPVLDRIKDSTGARTQVELAAVLGIRQSSISDAKRRNSVPSDWYLKLFRKYGLNPDWLAYGRGPQYIKTKEGYHPYDEPLLSSFHEDAAAYGDPLAAGKTVTFYAMTGENTKEGKWKPSALGDVNIPLAFDRESLLVLQMDGASMEPIIKSGAFVGLDREQMNVRSGELYAVQMPYEGLVVKRIFLDQGQGRYLLRAQDPTVGEQSFPIEEFSDKIVGRVIWVIQEL
jgi:phage repressor protein C with HTH and peptisase S24 domain